MEFGPYFFDPETLKKSSSDLGNQLRAHLMKRLCMGIHISSGCIWAHQRHVVERRDQEAIIQHTQMDVLL